MAVTGPASLGRPQRGRTTFLSAFEGRRNSYGFLRLVFAAGVVVCHTVQIGGFFGGGVLTTPRSHVDVGQMCVYASSCCRVC